MSSSANGSFVSSDPYLSTVDGADVIYEVRFDANQAGSSVDLRSMVLEFCAQSPIIGDACTAPTGFDLNATTGDTNLALFNQQNTGGNNWSIDGTYSTVNKLVLTRAAGASIASGTVLGFDLGDGGNNGVDNPETTNTTFFARVVTFDSVTGAQEYSSTDVENVDDSPNLDAGTPNNAIDAGGFALSTAAQITITSRVPEKLTFCVYTVDGTPAHTCGQTSAVSGTAITLGDNNGVLSETEEFVNKEAKYTVSTNALNDVAIRLKAPTLKTSATCSDAFSQPCSIDSISYNGGATMNNASYTSSFGTEQFGLCNYLDVASAAGLTPAAPYDDGAGAGCSATTDNSNVAGNSTPNDAANGAEFGLFTDATAEGTMSTYGDIIATKSAGTYSTGILAILGNIAVTTEPGIYQSTFTFIATGTY
jgi:hypothetical protein